MLEDLLTHLGDLVSTYWDDPTLKFADIEADLSAVLGVMKRAPFVSRMQFKVDLFKISRLSATPDV